MSKDEVVPGILKTVPQPGWLTEHAVPHSCLRPQTTDDSQGGNQGDSEGGSQDGNQGGSQGGNQDGNQGGSQAGNQGSSGSTGSQGQSK